MDSLHRFSFFRASVEDLPLLVRARIDFLTEYWGPQEESSQQVLKDELMNFFMTAIQCNTYIAWLAMCDKEFAGIGGMVIQRKPGSFRVPSGESGYIMNMYTDPKFRSRGVAKGILARLIETGREMGLQYFELHSTEQGEKLYQNSNFQKHKEPTYRLYIEGDK